MRHGVLVSSEAKPKIWRNIEIFREIFDELQPTSGDF